MKNAIIYSVFLMFVIGCTKNDTKLEEQQFGSEPPKVPKRVEFDLNNDGIDDVSFEFGPNDLVTDGTVGYYGSVNPLNGSLLLLVIRDDAAYALETQLNDTIRKDESTSLTWYTSNWLFMDIDDTAEGLWPTDWFLSSSIKSNPYYVGIQVKENDAFLLGWLKLEIDKTTAVIEIVDYELTSENLLVVDR